MMILVSPLQPPYNALMVILVNQLNFLALKVIVAQLIPIILLLLTIQLYQRLFVLKVIIMVALDIVKMQPLLIIIQMLDHLFAQ